MITLGLVDSVDDNGVYVTMPGSKGVLRGPYKALSTVAAGTTVLVASTDDGEQVVVGASPGGDGAVSVLSFGAKADGATDCRAAIQSCIDAVAAAGGGVVSIPAGSYAIHSSLTLAGQENVTIRGQGWESTQIICSEGFLEASGSSDQATIEGLHIRCSASTNSYDGIVVDYPRRWLVRQCYIEGFGNDSIRFEGGLHSKIEHNYIKARDAVGANGHAGIRLTDTDGSVAGSTISTLGNYIGAGVEYGMYVDRVSRGLYAADIAEGVVCGFRFENATGVCVQPYTEAASGNHIEQHDAAVIIVGHLAEEPVVTWSGAAASERVVPQVTRSLVEAKRAVFHQSLAADELSVVVRNDAYNDSSASAAVRFQGWDEAEAGKIQSDRVGAYAAAASSDADLVLYAAVDGSDVERLRLLSAGGVALPDLGGAPSTPSSGGVLFCQSGALKYIGSSGTVTTVAPA